MLQEGLFYFSVCSGDWAHGIVPTAAA